MLDLTKKLNKNSKKTKLTPGKRPSTVIDVRPAEGYVDGQAFEVLYLLNDGNGNEFEFQELFRDDDYNERTQNFYEYLLGNGITSLDDFVGCEEELDIRKNTTNKGVFLTIFKRKFISKPALTATVTQNAV